MNKIPLSIDIKRAKPQAFQEKPIYSGWNSARIISDNATVSYTPDPDTNYTFGVPNPTTIRVFLPSPTSPTSSSISDQDETRKRRYSQAEEALANTAQHVLAEPPARILQIRTLKQAEAVLKAKAEEARERAVKIKVLLTESTNDRRERQSLQQERWREERRLARVEDEAKTVSQQLAALSNSKSAAVIPEPTPAPSVSRKDANLIRFLQSSHSRHTVKPKSNIVIKDKRTARRVTLSEVTSMQLRSPPDTHIRSHSLDFRANNPLPSFPKTPIPTSPPRIRERAFSVSPLDAVAESSFEASTPDLSFTTDTPSPEVEPSTPQNVMVVPHDSDGTVLIHASHAVKLRSTAELMAELPPVTLPAYALDLLDDFDDRRQPRLTLDRLPSKAPRPSQEWELLPMLSALSSPDLLSTPPDSPIVRRSLQDDWQLSPSRRAIRRPMSLSFLRPARFSLSVIPESSGPVCSPKKQSCSPKKQPVLRARASLRKLFS